MPVLALAEISPINDTDRIVAPVQLIAGSRDRRVPVSQSRELLHLLKEGGNPVELVEFESATHNITNVKILDSIEAFLEEQLSGQPTEP